MMDSGFLWRENRCVDRPGASRKRIARKLNAAYAGGLLSEDTFVRRLDQLLEARLVDPFQLVGDLSFRRSADGRRASLVRAISRAARRVRNRPAGRVEAELELLALDWDGGHKELLIGRHHSCDVVLCDPSVSRRHARLVFRDGSWVLQDLASTNGTAVNGVRVGRCELRPGDHLALGDEQLKVD
jgi:hypothetical protein